MTFQNRIIKTAPIVAALVSFAVGLLSFFLASPPNQAIRDLKSDTKITVLQKKIDDLNALNIEARKALTLEATVDSKGRASIQLQRLDRQLSEIDARLGKLETAILANPAKALEIPLLQRDVDNLKTSQQSGIAALKDSIDRVYDLNKWLLGAMAVSIISLAMASFIKGKDNNTTKE